MSEQTNQKPYEIIGFEGTQVRTSRFLKKKPELDLAQNVDFDEIGSLGKKQGYAQRGSALTETTSTSSSTSTSTTTTTTTSTTTTSTSTTA